MCETSRFFLQTMFRSIYLHFKRYKLFIKSINLYVLYCNLKKNNNLKLKTKTNYQQPQKTQHMITIGENKIKPDISLTS